MKSIKINLNSKKYPQLSSIVDKSDFEFLNQWKWHLNQDGYAVRKVIVLVEGKVKYGNIFMHRVINKTPEGSITDHINRNRLDNRKSNLRVASYSVNRLNSKMHTNNTSGVKGISWDKSKNKWLARVWKNYKQIILGRYVNFNDAVFAREQAERLYY